jgi:hypothetical protein
LLPQASDKRSAAKTGRRKREPQGDSTPDQAVKKQNPQGFVDERQVFETGSKAKATRKDY